MPYATLRDTKSTTDYQLERRIALALLTVRAAQVPLSACPGEHGHATGHGRARSVQVAARDGVVTLSGNVPTLGEKIAARYTRPPCARRDAAWSIGSTSVPTRRRPLPRVLPDEQIRGKFL